MNIPEVVIDYLEKIGLKDNKADLKEQFINEFGSEGSSLYFQYEQVCTEREKIRESQQYTSNQVSLVNFSNINKKMSMILERYFNYDIHVHFLSWLYEVRDSFGKDIIDLGCGAGITSCFVAYILPNSYIVAVDESENAIKVANEIKAELGLKNIEFRCQNVQKLCKCKYDTVLSTRFIHENIGAIRPVYGYLMPSKSVEIAAKMHRKIVRAIGNLLVDDGKLICIERYSDDYLATMFYYGLLQELNNNGFMLPDSFNYLECKEDTGIKRFPAIVLQKGVDKKNVLEVYEKSKKTFIDVKSKFEGDDDYYSLEGIVAKIILEDIAGNVVECFHTEDNVGTWCGMGALYRYKDKKDYYVVIQQNKYKICVTKLIRSEKDEAVMNFKTQRETDRKAGFKIIESIHFVKNSK